MTTRTRTLVVTLAVLAALTGCSAASDAGGDSGLSADDAARAADVAPEGAQGAPPGLAGDGAATGSVAADAQQVVQTAHATLTAPDPVAAAREVVALVTRLDGRVDARYERSGSREDDPGSATLTLRVPSSAMATLSDDLGEIADLREFLVETENVTTAALDLDARITATELSVERMADLLGRASSNTDIIEAERALTERQANLERLRSERARLADRVALSTVHVEIYAPEEAPEVLREEPQTFLDGLETGWTAFVSFVRGLLLVVGVLLPWLALAGLVGGGILLVRRRRRARRDGVRPDLAPEPSASQPPTTP